MRRKMLVVSIAMPPKNDPECIQSGRYVKFLNKIGSWDITVVTSKVPTLFMPFDETLSDYLKGVKVVEIQIVENKYLNFLLRKFNVSVINRPDSKMTFHWQWKKVLKSVDKPDVIYSRSNPLSSALMALKLKKAYNVPWIMHLSDPWVESPLNELKYMNKVYHQKMELECFNMASLVTFTSQKTIELYSEKYPEYSNKFEFSPNVFEYNAEESQSHEIARSQKIRIVYTGGLANTRTAETFLQALDIILKEEPDLLSNLEVVFAGEMDSNNRLIFSSYRNISCVKHVGVLSQNDAFNLQKSAQILLVIDSDVSDEKRNVFFPSKLLDYYVKRKWIIAVTNKESPTSTFLSGVNGISFDFNEYEELAKYISKILKKELLIPELGALDMSFSAEKQSLILSEKIANLLR